MHKSIHYLTLLCCIANSTVVFSSEAAKQVPQVPKRTIMEWKPDPAYQAALEDRQREKVHQRGKKRARLEQRLFLVKDEMVEWTEYKKSQNKLLAVRREFYQNLRALITNQLGPIFNTPLPLLEQHQAAAIKPWRDLMDKQRGFLQEQEEIHEKTVRAIDDKLLPLCIERRALERAIHNIDTGYQWKSKP